MDQIVFLISGGKTNKMCFFCAFHLLLTKKLLLLMSWLFYQFQLFKATIVMLSIELSFNSRLYCVDIEYLLLNVFCAGYKKLTIVTEWAQKKKVNFFVCFYHSGWAFSVADAYFWQYDLATLVIIEQAW